MRSRDARRRRSRSIELRSRSLSSLRSAWSASRRRPRPAHGRRRPAVPMPRKTTPRLEAQVRVRRVARALGEHGDRRAGGRRLVDGAPGRREDEVGLDHLGRHAAHVCATTAHARGELGVAAPGPTITTISASTAPCEEPGAARGRGLPGSVPPKVIRIRSGCSRTSFGGRSRNSPRSVAYAGPVGDVRAASVVDRVQRVDDPVGEPRAGAEVLDVDHAVARPTRCTSTSRLGRVEHVVDDEVAARAARAPRRSAVEVGLVVRCT